MPEAEAIAKTHEVDTSPWAAELRRCALLRNRPKVAGAIRYWWQLLALTPAEAQQQGLPRPWSPGLRATLRRCDSPEAVVLTEGFRRL
ncbi:MAG TPA: hypothetical protein VK110_00685 [Salinisphaeraceae bacterium]|nr:hypothetical protein [Salinisphaeraceae bacterium]